MKILRPAVIPVLVLAATLASAQSPAQKAFDALKTLQGTWVGKSPAGQGAEVTYRVMSGGTIVMADQKFAGEDMTSMFYVQGGTLWMTHYCPSNNQPRMRATVSPDGMSVSFDFVDATNLPGPEAGHMHRALYLFADPEHYSEDWTWKQEGKESRMHFDMQRKK